MKESKKRLILLGCLVIALSLIAVPPSIFSQQEVRIGTILPLSGSLAPIGEDLKIALDYAVERINEAGGVKALGGAKLKLIYADSTGVPEVGTSEAERLVTREKVRILTGAYQSAVTFASSTIGEKYRIPYVTLTSVQDDIVVGRGFKYIFRPGNMSSQNAETMVNFLLDMNKNQKVKATKIAAIYENTSWGQSTIASVKKLIKDTDLKLIMDEPYPSKLPDFSSIASKIKNLAPDVIFRVQYISDTILLTKALAEKKVDVMAVIGPGGGENDPTYMPAVGNLGNYHMSAPSYSPSIPLAMPALRPIYDDYVAKTGKDISANNVWGIINMYLIVDALERAKSLEPEKIRDALAATDIKAENTPWFLVPYEGIKFSSEGQNIYSRCIISQYIDKKLYAVWPEKYQMKGKELVWPMPSWQERAE